MGATLVTGAAFVIVETLVSGAVESVYYSNKNQATLVTGANPPLVTRLLL